jgi:hypothetical protein
MEEIMASAIRYASSITLPVLMAGLLFGCSDAAGGGTVELGFTASGQALTTAAADGGTIDLDAGTVGPRILLNVVRVDIHVAGNDDPDDPPNPPNPPPPNPPHEGGWITIFSGAAQVDLLQAGSVETFLASAPVPAGKITQIRLAIADAIWTDGTATAPVQCPSCTQTGLKIVTMGKVVVPSGGTLRVTLDFDRERSVRADKDGYRLDPVVKIARVAVR